MTWFLIVQILLTGQKIALPQPSEAVCRADLAQLRSELRAGISRTVILADGVALPVARGIECVSQPEFEARKGNRT